MFNSAVQLTFPCPACGGFLTLRTFRAMGPCPTCGTQLEVSLHVRPIVPQITPSNSDSASGRKFDERRFRPSPQSP